MNQQENNKKLSKENIQTIISNQKVRKVIARESHNMFFHLYFSNFTKYQTADFQKEMFNISEDNSIKIAVIVAFRGSAKSTIMTMSYPIWAILGKLQKKCIVILSQTQQQAKIHFTNIKRELESNDLLKADLGPFQEEADEWGSYSLVVPRFDAKIIAASCEQSIRGLRHRSYRPDLIICDDIEDLNSVKTKEGRDKVFNWFSGEIIPLGDKSTRIILVGNLLHEDSLLMRLKESIEKGKLDGIYKEYPLFDNEGKILWTGKYANMDEIENFKRNVGDEKAWQREYLLKIISDEDQIVKREWIKYYDELPHDNKAYENTSIGIDLAISTKDTADYTAMVVGHVFREENETFKVYIAPWPINKRMDYLDTLNEAKNLAKITSLNTDKSIIYVEDVAFQTIYIQQLENDGYDVEGFAGNSGDKRSKLASISHYIKSGKVLFPRVGAEDLITQLVYFGVEKHDDLCDAFTILMHKESSKKHYRVYVGVINFNNHINTCSEWDDDTNFVY